jgi:hypothetical protein
VPCSPAYPGSAIVRLDNSAACRQLESSSCQRTHCGVGAGITITSRFEEGLDLARRSHALSVDASPHQLMHATWPLMAALYHLGRWRELLPTADEHIAAFDQDPAVICQFVRDGPVIGATVLAHRGELERARRLAAMVGDPCTTGQRQRLAGALRHRQRGSRDSKAALGRQGPGAAAVRSTACAGAARGAGGTGGLDVGQRVPAPGTGPGSWKRTARTLLRPGRGARPRPGRPAAGGRPGAAPRARPVRATQRPLRSGEDPRAPGGAGAAHRGRAAAGGRASTYERLAYTLRQHTVQARLLTLA